MEFPLIELVSKLLLGAPPKLLNLEHPNFVGTRLPRHDDVTFDFSGHIFFAHPRFLEHVSNCLLTRPSFGVDPGIDDQPDSAKQFIAQTSQVAEWIALIPSDLFCEPFAIKSPALGIRSERDNLAKLGETLQFLSGRDLPMMPRYPFVVGQGGHAPLRNFI